MRSYFHSLPTEYKDIDKKNQKTNKTEEIFQWYIKTKKSTNAITVMSKMFQRVSVYLKT